MIFFMGVCMQVIGVDVLSGCKGECVWMFDFFFFWTIYFFYFLYEPDPDRQFQLLERHIDAIRSKV